MEPEQQTNNLNEPIEQTQPANSGESPAVQAPQTQISSNGVPGGAVNPLPNPVQQGALPEKLTKSFKNAGNSTFAIGVFMLFAYPISTYVFYLMGGGFSLVSFVTTFVILTAFMAYFIYAGLSLKKDNFSEPKKSFLRALVLMIVSIISIFVFIPGGILVLFYIMMVINNIAAFSQISKYKKALT